MIKTGRRLEDKVNENGISLSGNSIGITSTTIKNNFEELISSGKQVLSKDNFFAGSNNFKLYFIDGTVYEEFILPQSPFMLKFIKENNVLYEKIKSKMVDYSKDKSLKNEVETLLYEAYLIIRQYPESPSNYDICK